jgi:hypothetical protein
VKKRKNGAIQPQSSKIPQTTIKVQREQPVNFSRALSLSVSSNYLSYDGSAMSVFARTISFSSLLLRNSDVSVQSRVLPPSNSQVVVLSVLFCRRSSPPAVLPS